MFPSFSFILGGAGSGKSLWAEGLALRTGLPLQYVATAKALDSEMSTKIERHKDRRGSQWSTVEAPINVETAIRDTPPESAILIDCLTVWLSNLLHAERNLEAARTGLLDAIAMRRAPVICVSNELGLGLVPETPLGRQFRDAQGALNQAVAAEAGLVVFVAAGLPLALKGKLPEGHG